MERLFCFSTLLLSIVLEIILKFQLTAGTSSIRNPIPGTHPVKRLKIWKQSFIYNAAEPEPECVYRH